MKNGKDGQPPKSRRKQQKPDAAFDTWLQRGLHDLYDGVANEPIPEELLRIIEEDQKK